MTENQGKEADQTCGNCFYAATHEDLRHGVVLCYWDEMSDYEVVFQPCKFKDSIDFIKYLLLSLVALLSYAVIILFCLTLAVDLFDGVPLAGSIVEDVKEIWKSTN